MKRLILTLMLVAMPSVAFGGSLITGYVETGGYGAATAKFTQLGDGETGFFLGGGGGFILDRRFMIGAELSLLANDIPYDTSDGDRRFIEYTMLNLNFSYLLWPESTVHAAVSVAGGMGWLKLRNPDKAVDERDADADTVFQGWPSAQLILNLTGNVRLTASAGYRWVTGINTEGFVDQDAEGAFGEIAVMFGAF